MADSTKSSNFQYIQPGPPPQAMIRIVRPFDTPGDLRPRPPQSLQQPPYVPPDKEFGFVTWGAAGNDIFQLRANLKSEVPKPNWDETERKVDTVRVYNKDDREQYVDTEVMTEFSMRNKISKDRFIIRFGAPENTQNTEVIKRGQSRTNKNGG